MEGSTSLEKVFHEKVLQAEDLIIGVAGRTDGAMRALLGRGSCLHYPGMVECSGEVKALSWDGRGAAPRLSRFGKFLCSRITALWPGRIAAARCSLHCKKAGPLPSLPPMDRRH